MDPERRPKGRSFSFNISFGKKPPAIDDPKVRELLDRALADATESPDGTGSASLSGAIDRTTGEAVSLDDPRIQELLKRAEADAAQSADGVGMASNTETYSVDLREGLEKLGDLLGASPRYEDASTHAGQAEDPRKAREREMWDRLHLIAEGKGAYPDTQRWHSWLSTATWVIAISLPIAVLILALATGQDQQTVFVMTFGAVIVAAMFRSSIR
jgi:hypothetical protein